MSNRLPDSCRWPFSSTVATDVPPQRSFSKAKNEIEKTLRKTGVFCAYYISSATLTVLHGHVQQHHSTDISKSLILNFTWKRSTSVLSSLEQRYSWDAKSYESDLKDADFLGVIFFRLMLNLWFASSGTGDGVCSPLTHVLQHFVKIYSNSYTGLDRPWGFQEI